jgi:hypothetical protein
MVRSYFAFALTQENLYFNECNVKSNGLQLGEVADFEALTSFLALYFF